ncbi:WecB/TagA/CpsF family glycosyltransferase [Candidatus Sulfidibacterium hydrothermale]|uniref:WecB/TagA/CpsF family glycosyltransferase n=1 Tax=Candidatus Sulfidibacterium hydrothermale TaxID=2875962 RepID=UPI001F0B6F2E|nr:WecB/TagA/CpsF family glycosyltransferase [Candidatus Sulfidibacterium hydrothermale]UBM62451.1 WecB/TagA/CpsF family glycosyltransferase [Candidatus Sulfidibacterium hydrothermale]
MKPVSINNVHIYPFKDYNDAISYVENNKGILVAVNAEKILHATDQTRKVINNNIGYPDGVGAVWALKKKGINSVKRIPGVELWLHIIRKYYKTNSFYLVGSTKDVINITVNKLKNEFFGINILNFRDGFIKNKEEKKELLDDIKKKKPDIVFVAMGSPRQELIMQEMYKIHPAIYQGLGGSFDVYAGKVKRAPKVWQQFNLEWLYRWYKQPLARTKRNLQLTKFIYYLYFNKFQ